MTEEERLRQEIELLRRDIERDSREIDKIAYDADTLKRAADEEEDFRLRGKLVMEHGAHVTRMQDLRDGLTAKLARLEKSERMLRLEETFAENRRQKIESKTPQDVDSADDLLERRRMRRERKQRIDGL